MSVVTFTQVLQTDFCTITTGRHHSVNVLKIEFSKGDLRAEELETCLAEMEKFFQKSGDDGMRFYTILDFCANVPLTDVKHLFRVAEFFKSHKTFLVNGYVCTVLVCDNPAVRTVTSIFLKLYDATRPIYLLTSSDDPCERVDAFHISRTAKQDRSQFRLAA